MLVREYTDADFGRLQQLHSQSSFDYKLPTLSKDVFFSRRLVGDGKSIGMGAFLKHTAEAYLICDPDWRTPAWRMEALRQLCLVCNEDAKSQGVREVEAFLPPEVERKFGKRLSHMGWARARSGWVNYSKVVI